ncbi:MAG: tetratricopeptide repeat protein [Treponema sp.]|nr:tetratricopeptide repeat protein [Treponema sp.]
MNELEPLNRSELEERYERLFPVYKAVLDQLCERVTKCLQDAGIHPTLKSRVKSFPSWFRKRILLLQQARAAGRKTVKPINDVLAVRVICPFMGDLEWVETELSRCFKVVEVERKGADRSFREFGYESTHILVEIPADLRRAEKSLDLGIFEIQVRTILQDAWAEVEHELVYKAEFNPFDEPMKRKLAALNANLSLSDIIFQELRDYQHRLTNELDKRRTNFFRKIEKSIDEPFFPERTEDLSLGAPAPAVSEYPGCESSIDEMLVAALNAHNRDDYVAAIETYSCILSREPKPEIAALIHKHRGMAYFAESRYAEAISDFSRTLDLDPVCYKAAYYRGVVHSVLGDYTAAVRDFETALDIHPYHFYSLYRRSQAYFHLGDYPKALADCESALRLDPENEQAVKMKSLILDRLRM